MGSFFTNVQVQMPPGVEPTDLLDTVTHALTSLAAERGMIPCAAASTAADRTVVLRPSERGWLSVYDEGTEDQDAQGLDVLARELSRATGGMAVTVLVHDSDILRLALFRKGKCLDRYDSHPAYFCDGELSKKELATVAGKPDRWAPLLTEGHRREDLARAWREKKLFAEATLARTSELLGWTEGRAAVGFRYLEDDLLGGGVVRLRYCHAKLPAHRKEAEGVPRFVTDLPPEVTLRPVELALAVGDELRVSCTCRNAGGAGRGIAIRAWGSALEKGLVEVTAFELLVGNVLKGAKHVAVGPEVSANHVWHATVDHAIPAGLRGGLASLAGASWREVQEAMMRAQVHVNAVGRVVAPGQGELYVALIPSEREEGGAHATAYRLDLDTPLWRPLRATPEEQGGAVSHLFRPLSGRDHVVAMVVYGVSQPEAAIHAASAFRRFALASPRVDRYEKAIFRADPSSRPRTGSVQAGGLFAGKRWRAIQDAFRAERQVTLAPPFDLGALAQGESPTRVGHGLTFGRNLLPVPCGPDDGEVCALMLWSHGPGLHGALGVACEVVEEAMRECDGIQGFVTRWGAAGGSLDSTQYEQAAGIHGPTMLRSWSTRWLRALGNHALWLGPELRSKLARDDLAALSSLAEEMAGGTLRVVLRTGDNEEVSRVERALAVLLPTLEDAWSAQTATYQAK
jgi:hypothetical protein